MMVKYLKSWIAQKWTTASLSQNQQFLKIDKHACVVAEGKAVVAMTGPCDDEESQALADLFSAAPAMCNELLIATQLLINIQMRPPTDEERKNIREAIVRLQLVLAKANGGFSVK